MIPKFQHNRHRKELTVWALLLFTGLCLSPVQAKDKNKAIDVQITTHLGDQQVFIAGDTIAFLVSLNQDAYLNVIYQDAQGRLTLIIPNTRRAKAFYKADQFISIPGPEDRFEFYVQEPFGDEKLWVLASHQALELRKIIPGEELEQGLYALQTDMDGLEQTLKTLRYSKNSLAIQTRPSK